MKKLYTILFVLTCFCMQLRAQVPNPGFENWAVDSTGGFNPVGWFTPNDGIDTPVIRVGPGCAGSYAMKVRVYNPGFVIPGIAYADFPYSGRPTSFKACVTATVISGDQIIIMYSSMKDDSIVIAASANCTFKILASISTQNITFPLAYVSSENPETANITVLAGNFTNAKVGTEVTIDEVSLGFGVGNREIFVPLSAILGQNYPNPSANSTLIPITLGSAGEVSLEVYDMSGKLVRTIPCGFMNSGKHHLPLDVKDLEQGLYYYTVKGEGFVLSKQFVVER